MKHSIIFIAGLLLLTACSGRLDDSGTYEPNRLLSETEMLANPDILSGVYYAYPGPEQEQLTPAPTGYEAFYISHYGRHGSRYQPNDTRYANTRLRLQIAHECENLTELGEKLLTNINLLCDSCLGHGGMLTTIGAQQHHDIGMRMAQRWPEVFSATYEVPGQIETSLGHYPKHISARASVVPRCGASMHAFLSGLSESGFLRSTVIAEVDSAYMSYIAYDTPQMRELGSKTAEWQEGYRQNVQDKIQPFAESLTRRIFSDASGLDTLQMINDLYWLVIGMQNVDVPGCDISYVFTPEEMLRCWQCVNYRMYVCNGNAPLSNGIPAQSASTLLQNIVQSADEAIATDTIAATLRFGHDSNLLRLLALMRIHNSANQVSDPADAWMIWQENRLSPMGANLQLVFYRNAEGDVLVKILHNENEITIDGIVPSVDGIYYRWSELRESFLSWMQIDGGSTEFIEPVQ